MEKFKECEYFQGHIKLKPPDSALNNLTKQYTN